jgi:hypothetical protein
MQRPNATLSVLHEVYLSYASSSQAARNGTVATLCHLVPSLHHCVLFRSTAQAKTVT